MPQILFVDDEHPKIVNQGEITSTLNSKNILSERGGVFGSVQTMTIGAINLVLDNSQTQVNEAMKDIELKIIQSEKQDSMAIKYCENSIYVFSLENKFRNFLIKMIDSKTFEYTMIVIILINCVVLSLFDYQDRDSLTFHNQLLDYFNLGFTCIFIAEALAKIIAQGFIFHKNAYLRTGWNIIDSVVVFCGILELTMGSVKLKALRVMRIFRPLKTINALPGMKELIGALISSIPEFSKVLLFLVFIFILFSAMGLHQYTGYTHNACRVNQEPESNVLWVADVTDQRVCSVSGLGNYICPSGMRCGNPDMYPQMNLLAGEDMELRPYVNFGITSFDNIGTSLMSVFQIITSDTWYQQLCNMMDADIPAFGIIYCWLMIIMGLFFMLNLFLAVIVCSFIQSQKQEMKKKIEFLRDEQSRIDGKIQTELEKTIINEPQEKEKKEWDVDKWNGPFADLKSKDSNKNKQIVPASKVSQSLLKSKTQREPSFKNQHMQQNNSNHGCQSTKSSTKNQATDFSTFLKPQIQKRKIANMLVNLLKIKLNEEKTDKQDTIKEQRKQTVNIIVEEISENESDKMNSPENGGLIAESKLKLNSKKSRLSSYLEEDQISEQSSVVRFKKDRPHFTPFSVKHKPTQRFISGLFDDFQNQQDEEFVEDDLSLGEEIRLTEEENKLEEIAVTYSNEETSKNVIALAIVNNLQMKIGQFLKTKIDEEKSKYFKNVIDESVQNVDSEKAMMRELVGIKVGLEYLRQKQVCESEMKQQEMINDKRKKQSIFFRVAKHISGSAYFTSFIAISIIVNTLILSLDSYPEDIQRTSVIEKLNILFSMIFLFELIVRLLSIGLKEFFNGPWLNTLDCIIVVASLIDLILTNTVLNNENKSNGALITAIRGFRLLRIFKLAKTWKKFELLLQTFGKTLKDVVNFAIFICLFIFIFTLLGMELFAYKAKIDPDARTVDNIDGVSPELNFDTFINSFSMVFILLTNDGSFNYYSIFYRAVGPLPTTIFFVIIAMLGQRVIINLFIAILLENFDESSLKQKLDDIETKKQGEGNFKKLITNIQEIGNSKNSIFRRCFKKQAAATGDQIQGAIAMQLKQQFKELSSTSVKKEEFISKRDLIEENHSGIEGKSLNIFSHSNRLRIFAYNTVNSKYFPLFILAVIVASSIQLALESPHLDPQSKMASNIFWADMAFTIIFTLEVLLKVVAFGFISNGNKSYIRQSMNMVDFSVIMLSLLAQTSVSPNLKAFKVVRILRIISRSEGLLVAVRAIVKAIPNILNITIIMLLFFLIFGVIAVSQFKGKFFSCSSSIPVQTELQSKWDCLNAGGLWSNKIYIFDDIPNAIITLFVMATTVGWADIFLLGVSSTEIDYIANKDVRNPIWILFFMVFMIVGFFFFINLFIGVVVTNFNTEQDKLGGNHLLTEKQREWIDLKLLVLQCGPIRKIKPPQNQILLGFFKLQNLKSFENFISMSIVINTFTLTLKWYEQDPNVSMVLDVINYNFTAIFCVEALIKILGQTPSIYFRESWNRFDFIVAIGSLISIIVSLFSSLQLKGTTTLLRSFRVLRILRLVKRGGRSLRMIFNTFVITLRSLANIGCLLLLIIYVYAIAGIIFFGRSKRNGIMNNYMNFENFGNAFMTLFVLTTGDSWSVFQASFIVENTPDNPCIDNPTYSDYISNGVMMGCGTKAEALTFFTSFIFIVNLIFLQLFIAVILQGYDDTQVQEARLFNNNMTQQFREVWAEYDPDATTYIPIYELRNFLHRLGQPLGFDQSFQGQRFFQDTFIAQLDLPTYHDFSHYQYLDVLDALSFRLMVLDHINRSISESAAKSQSNILASTIEIKVKEALSKEVNQLIFQRNSQRISAVQEVMMKEMKRGHHKIAGKDKNGFSSSHHMAAEATVRQMKLFARLSRRSRYEIDGNMKMQSINRPGCRTVLDVRKYRRNNSQLRNQCFSGLTQIEEESKLEESQDSNEGSSFKESNKNKFSAPFKKSQISKEEGSQGSHQNDDVVRIKFAQGSEDDQVSESSRT